MQFIILLSLILGVIGWGMHLFFMCIAFMSKKRWTLYIDYNQFHEAIIEFIVIIILIILGIIAIVKY